MCKFRIDQYLIVVNLNNISINEILVTEFVTVKVSQNQNLMQVQIDRFPLSNCCNKKPRRKSSSKQTEMNILSSINQM